MTDTAAVEVEVGMTMTMRDQGGSYISLSHHLVAKDACHVASMRMLLCVQVMLIALERAFNPSMHGHRTKTTTC